MWRWWWGRQWVVVVRWITFIVLLCLDVFPIALSCFALLCFVFLCLDYLPVLQACLALCCELLCFVFAVQKSFAYASLCLGLQCSALICFAMCCFATIFKHNNYKNTRTHNACLHIIQIYLSVTTEPRPGHSSSLPASTSSQPQRLRGFKTYQLQNLTASTSQPRTSPGAQPNRRAQSLPA